MKKSLIATLATASLFITSMSMAGSTKHQKSHYTDRQVFTDYAYVTRVNPVYERLSQCNDDESYYNGRRGHHGHNSNHGNHKKHSRNKHQSVNKVIGAIHNKHLSISFGHGHNNHRRNCKTGYDVTYRYHGHSYTTFTKHRPGHRIELKVKLTPIVD